MKIVVLCGGTSTERDVSITSGRKVSKALESNGHQNYSNWEKMKSYYPSNKAPWIDVHQGFYDTNKEYFKKGGGIFEPIPHYEKMFSSFDGCHVSRTHLRWVFIIKKCK